MKINIHCHICKRQIVNFECDTKYVMGRGISVIRSFGYCTCYKSNNKLDEINAFPEEQELQRRTA